MRDRVETIRFSLGILTADHDFEGVHKISTDAAFAQPHQGIGEAIHGPGHIFVGHTMMQQGHVGVIGLVGLAFDVLVGAADEVLELILAPQFATVVALQEVQQIRLGEIGFEGWGTLAHTLSDSSGYNSNESPI